VRRPSLGSLTVAKVQKPLLGSLRVALACGVWGRWRCFAPSPVGWAELRPRVFAP